jgi:hypothetical protein
MTTGTNMRALGMRKAARVSSRTLTITIGRLPVRFSLADSSFRALLAERYSSFLQADASCRERIEFEVRTVAPGHVPGPEGLEVRCEGGKWRLGRGDFRAEFDLRARHGTLTLFPNPYSVDALLRIVHSLLLASSGGVLLHASSGIRNGRGVVFSGISGAGKTTIARLAPAGVQLLTDEVSYLRREGSAYRVYGTPFSGELGLKGEDVSAPLAAIHLIEHGAENRREALAPSEAVRRLLRNVLFFAQEPDLVAGVFATLCDLVERVPVYRLAFAPDARVWELAA